MDEEGVVQNGPGSHWGSMNILEDGKTLYNIKAQNSLRVAKNAKEKEGLSSSNDTV
jgi:hypothetical protein